MAKTKLSLISIVLFVLVFLTSCTILGNIFGSKTGTLPSRWWTKDVGEVENYYKERATSIEKDIKMFIARSDSAMNIDQSTALENSRLDAAVQLSRYLSQKVTSVLQSSQHVDVIQKALSDGDIDKEQADEIQRTVDERLAAFSASVTSTQFSSFKEIGQHSEKMGNKYIAYVCYSMTDQILEETRKLQDEAFKTLMEETAEYKEIMQEIQEVIAESMKENILEETKI